MITNIHTRVAATAAVMATMGLCLVSLAAPPRKEAAASKDHDITKARVTDRVILAVMENYYDPSRVDTRAMFEAAAEALQAAVAEVRVRDDEAAGTLTVEILDARLVTELDRVRSPWGLSRALKRVFAFVAKELPRKERDFLELEYAAANGLLSVLDPHTQAMMPDQWAELRMAIQGVFEGIGIRITTDRRPPCGGDLTVVEVFEDTPAMRAGLRKGDKILRIDGESTVNITTSEAADRLRGPPGTKVTVELKRADGGRKEIEIPRGKIPIESVKWELLDGKVGYVSLDSFSDNSGAELAGALGALRAKKMKGLVLDLRENPGGSLGSAIEVADLFLDSGTIVTTAGRTPEDREVENATSKGTEPAYPMVVLTSASSASAAEIIAGAVKNHGRALLVGDTTFGKGSVQRIMPLPSGGALRITTAQYLTPGDISIQAIGVPPDVRFTPVVIDREELNLDSSKPLVSEADLDAHLERPSSLERADRRGAVEALVFVPPDKLKADAKRFDLCYSDEPDRETFLGRHQREFSRRLIAATDAMTATELRVAAEDLLGADAARNEAEISAALRKVGVDWSPAPAATAGEAKVDPAIKVTAGVKGAAIPGRKIELWAKVTNGGAEAIHRLRAVTSSDNPLLAQRELVFGKIAPGKTKTWTTVIDLPLVAQARLDPVTLEFFAQHGAVPPPASVDIAIADQPDAKIAYAWHLEDLGNGNGLAEPGEAHRLIVEISNMGDRRTFDLDVDLSAKPGVDVVKGHFEVAPLAVGKRARGVFELSVAEGFEPGEAELELSVTEWIPAKHPMSRSLLSRRIDLPVVEAAAAPSTASGTVTVSFAGGVALLAAPKNGARVIAGAPDGASFQVDGRFGDYFRVLVDDGVHAWLTQAATRPGGDGKGRAVLRLTEPPRIAIDGKAVVETAADRYGLRGHASHAQGIKDLMVFVGERKVAYLLNRGKDRTRLDFALDVPLEEGANQVVVIARHDDDTADSKWVFVRRGKPRER